MADEMLRYETIGRKDFDNLNPLHPLSFRINFDGKIEIENPNKKTPDIIVHPTIRSKNSIPTIIIQPKDLCTMSLKPRICQ